MQCPFCSSPCQPDNSIRLSDKLQGWKCDQHAHQVRVVAVPDEVHFAYFFTCRYRDREYSIECYKLPQGEQCDFRCGSELVAHFEFIPQHLTPDSIDRRIKTLLVFS